ncbi:MAG: permease [Deltaproteobacteria bacterium]|nr:permease [Deltaproteobacteria bacterium]
MDSSAFAFKLVQAGLANLATYLAAHILLCLVPAFCIAGCMAALIPKGTVTRLLGRNTPRLLSYPAAILAASVLSVCSCTIVPLFAGIYKKGAGLGPAITFLFFAPAANILALLYTGSVIGVDLALARFFLSLAFGVSIGMIMALLFRREDIAHDTMTDTLFTEQGQLSRPVLFFLLTLVAILLAGVLKIDLLTKSYSQLFLPIPGMDRFQEILFSLVPFDASKSEEGVTAQGAILIALLMAIALTAWKGLENIIEEFNGWAWATLGLAALTLLTASVGMTPQPSGLVINLTGKSVGVAFSLALLTYLASRHLEEREVRAWLWETWKFVKQIFPLLIVGVFLVGVIRQFIRPTWIQHLAGSNTILGNLAGVIFGVFMYFPTLVEVPIAHMFLGLGMHRGPLLAYLMADPELSLQSILITSKIIGPLKTWTYVGWIALFSTLAGLLYGTWIDGVSIWLILLYLSLFLGGLALVLQLVSRRSLSPSPVP